MSTRPARSEDPPRARGISRRQFLKLSATTAGAAALAAGGAYSAGASTGVERENVPAMLVDVSRCVGCGNCQRSCNQANGLHPDAEEATQLSAQTFTVVEHYPLEGAERWVKRQCMHCLDAACVSACPVRALYRTPEGPVSYRPNRCLGCRYCMVSCPFDVPRFEWPDPLTPEIRKCMFCIQRQQNGQSPACVEKCPSGALRFGQRGDLLKEAHARIAAGSGQYVDHVYGEDEAGGTSWLYISDVPFEQVGFRTDVTKRAIPEYTWDIMAKLPFVVGGLAVFLTGASIYTRRRQGPHHDEPDWVKEK